MTHPRIAVYPGSFDPITNGHLDILSRSLRLFDKVIVALADNVRKKPLFTVEERRDQILAAVGHDPRVEVDAFSGLLVSYVKGRGAGCVVRGLRAIADFEYEFQLAHMNHQLAPDIETLFLMTDQQHFYVSSSLVKEVAQFGGEVSAMVPPGVATALRSRLIASAAEGK
jgi:pantetheine-phosphate adenylyltransferase